MLYVVDVITQKCMSKNICIESKRAYNGNDTKVCAEGMKDAYKPLLKGNMREQKLKSIRFSKLKCTHLNILT